MSNPFQQEEPTAVHNVRQLVGCLPLLGCLAVGVLGLVGAGIGLTNAGRQEQPSWLLGAGVCLLAAGLGFGVLAWVVWVYRQK